METVYTIGFTKKTAAQFFGTLKEAGVRRVVDIRLNNRSQLAGFTKRDDLEYFLRAICGADYVHEPLLAPSREILDAFKKKKGDWKLYERDFLRLMSERKVETRVSRALFDRPVALLCSEPTPEHCHRRLVAEYLQSRWGGFPVVHL